MKAIIFFFLMMFPLNAAALDNSLKKVQLNINLKGFGSSGKRTVVPREFKGVLNGMKVKKKKKRKTRPLLRTLANLNMKGGRRPKNRAIADTPSFGTQPRLSVVKDRIPDENNRKPYILEKQTSQQLKPSKASYGKTALGNSFGKINISGGANIKADLMPIQDSEEAKIYRREQRVKLVRILHNDIQDARDICKGNMSLDCVCPSKTETLLCNTLNSEAWDQSNLPRHLPYFLRDLDNGNKVFHVTLAKVSTWAEICWNHGIGQCFDEAGKRMMHDLKKQGPPPTPQQQCEGDIWCTVGYAFWQSGIN